MRAAGRAAKVPPALHCVPPLRCRWLPPLEAWLGKKGWSLGVVGVSPKSPWEELPGPGKGWSVGVVGVSPKSPWEELPGPGKGWSVGFVGVSPKSPWEEHPGSGMGEDGSVGVPLTSPSPTSPSSSLLFFVAALGPPITPLMSGSSPPLPPYLGLLRQEGSPSSSPSLLGWAGGRLEWLQQRPCPTGATGKGARLLSHGSAQSSSSSSLL